MGMLIGELAQRAGVKAQTIRYYESLGVLTPAARSGAGYRRYPQRAVEELVFIRKAQSLGFSLDDGRQVLQLARAGQQPCAQVLELAERHLAALAERIDHLTALHDRLGKALTKWLNGGAPTNCASTLCGLIGEAAETTVTDRRSRSMEAIRRRRRTETNVSYRLPGSG